MNLNFMHLEGCQRARRRLFVLVQPVIRKLLLSWRQEQGKLTVFKLVNRSALYYTKLVERV